MADTASSLAAAAEASFSTLLHSTASQVSEIKNMCVMRGAGALAAADLKALNQRAVSAEASLLELSVYAEGEEENINTLQALVDQARDLRDATAYMKGHLPFNLPPAAAGARRA